MTCCEAKIQVSRSKCTKMTPEKNAIEREKKISKKSNTLRVNSIITRKIVKLFYHS